MIYFYMSFRFGNLALLFSVIYCPYSSLICKTPFFSCWWFIMQRNLIAYASIHVLVELEWFVTNIMDSMQNRILSFTSSVPCANKSWFFGWPNFVLSLPSGLFLLMRKRQGTAFLLKSCSSLVLINAYYSSFFTLFLRHIWQPQFQ